MRNLALAISLISNLSYAITLYHGGEISYGMIVRTLVKTGDSGLVCFSIQGSGSAAAIAISCVKKKIGNGPLSNQYYKVVASKMMSGINHIVDRDFDISCTTGHASSTSGSVSIQCL
jgi:hypothetical protein